MKKLCMIVFSVIFFTALSAAQTGGGDQGSMKGDKKGGGGSTVTGCLSGPNGEGVYELKSGKRTVEVGGNDELSKHVGHEVKLHGMWEKSGAAIGEKGETSAKGSKEEKGERHFKVSSIDHIADSCSGGEHHGKKGSSGSTTPPPKL
jgi:hypothetical protein